MILAYYKDILNVGDTYGMNDVESLTCSSLIELLQKWTSKIHCSKSE